MKLPEPNLIGWLCILRIQAEVDTSIGVPDPVSDELVSRGWLELVPGRCLVTDAGVAITDLHGPEWGLVTLTEAAL